MTVHQQNRAANYWHSGMDTNQIAKALKLPEATIYNHLETIKFRARIKFRRQA